MYLELTPEDTIKDMQNLLVNAIPGFEFPRKDLFTHTIQVIELPENETVPDDFVVGVIWGELSEDTLQIPRVLVDRSEFAADLAAEEINILALLMKESWVQRQVTSIENTRMKYSGADFKMSSQANHLSKLLSLLEESRRDSFHMQRLYKRRKRGANGVYESNWGSIMQKRAL